MSRRLVASTLMVVLAGCGGAGGSSYSFPPRDSVDPASDPPASQLAQPALSIQQEAARFLTVCQGWEQVQGVPEAPDDDIDREVGSARLLYTVLSEIDPTAKVTVPGVVKGSVEHIAPPAAVVAALRDELAVAYAFDVRLGAVQAYVQQGKLSRSGMEAGIRHAGDVLAQSHAAADEATIAEWVRQHCGS